MTKILPLLLLLLSFTSCEKSLKQTIDFKKNPDQFSQYISPQLIQASAAFNGAPEFCPFFSYLKEKYHLETAIETGTYLGNTTALLAQLFDQVHTIEVSEPTFKTTKETLKSYKNIHCHLGSSEKILKEILPSVREKPLLFYLDAHWEDHWPLREELEEIAKTHKDNCIIIIDDVKVPGRKDIPYDNYGSKACSHKYVKAQLDQVFSEYSYHYLIPKSVQSRAKFVAIPKKWKPAS